MTISRRVLLMAAAGTVLLAGLFQVAFSHFGSGLITPEGSVSGGVALLGLLTMTMRLAAIFGVPAMMGMFLGMASVDLVRKRLVEERHEETSPSPSPSPPPPPTQ